MRRNLARHAAPLALFAALAMSACNTAAFDAETGAPRAGEYPRFADMPPRPEDVPSDAAWEAAAADLMAQRNQLDENAEAMTRDLPSAEAVAEAARKRATPPPPIQQ